MYNNYNYMYHNIIVCIKTPHESYVADHKKIAL